MENPYFDPELDKQLAAEQWAIKKGLVKESNPKDALVRSFSTGATRNSDTNKYDYEGFLSPVVLEMFAAYMHINRKQADGSTRASDNWQKGIPKDAYIKSNWRHFHDLWKAHRGYQIDEGELAAAMGILFNTMGWCLEQYKEDPEWFQRELNKYESYRQKELSKVVL